MGAEEEEEEDDEGAPNRPSTSRPLVDEADCDDDCVGLEADDDDDDDEEEEEEEEVLKNPPRMSASAVCFCGCGCGFGAAPTLWVGVGAEKSNPSTFANAGEGEGAGEGLGFVEAWDETAVAPPDRKSVSESVDMAGGLGAAGVGEVARDGAGDVVVEVEEEEGEVEVEEEEEAAAGAAVVAVAGGLAVFVVEGLDTVFTSTGAGAGADDEADEEVFRPFAALAAATEPANEAGTGLSLPSGTGERDPSPAFEAARFLNAATLGCNCSFALIPSLKKSVWSSIKRTNTLSKRA